MADILIPQNGQMAGVPGQWSQKIPNTAYALLSGSKPDMMTTDEYVKANTAFDPLTVMMRDENGDLVQAVYSADGSQPAEAILITKSITPSTGHRKHATYRAGCYNPDALVWHASFDTMEKKMRAFEGAPTPTQIVIRPIRGYQDT